MKIIQIKETHYRAPLSWLTKCTEEEYYNAIKNLGFDEEYDLGGDAHYWGDKGYNAIWVNEELDPTTFLQKLNHELLHYCTATLHNKGVIVSYENDEDIAYFQEKMLRRCMRVNLKKKKLDK